MTDYDKPLLTDWELYRVILGVFLITFGAAGAAGGGIGGGGLYVPLLIIVIDFQTKEAVAISQGCIVGAAIAHLLLNAGKKHPLLNRPVVDYAALLVLEPMLLAGALIGVMVNGMLPSIVILLILICVLSLGAYKTGKRALRISKSEKDQSKADLQLTKDADKVAQNVEMATPETDNKTDDADAGAAELEEDLEEAVAESKVGWEYVMWKKLGTVSLLWLILCLGVIIRGSSVGESSMAGIYYCSGAFWGVFAIIPVVQILFSAFFGKLEIDKNSLSDKLEVQRTSSRALDDYAKVEWNWANVVRYMVYAFVCGLLAGCLGIGGGLVLSPLLLELGFYPAVASGISGMAVLVTSTSALLAYGLANKVYWQFVIVLMPLTFISTMIGKVLIDRYAERNNKQSAIIWSVAIFLILCLVMLTIRGLIELVDNPSFEFSSPCE
jgi:uncharacterized membrane protein YfcA